MLLGKLHILRHGIGKITHYELVFGSENILGGVTWCKKFDKFVYFRLYQLSAAYWMITFLKSLIFTATQFIPWVHSFAAGSLLTSLSVILTYFSTTKKPSIISLSNHCHKKERTKSTVTVYNSLIELWLGGTVALEWDGTIGHSG